MTLRLIGRLVLSLPLAYALLTPVADAGSLDEPACPPVTAEGQAALGVEGLQDSDGEDPEPDDFFVPGASSLSGLPLSSLITRRPNARLPLLVRSLFRPPTLL